MLGLEDGYCVQCIKISRSYRPEDGFDPLTSGLQAQHADNLQTPMLIYYQQQGS